MGHDPLVHQEYYRMPEATMQIAKLGKLLLEAENGKTAQNSGKTLDDIQIVDMTFEDNTESATNPIGIYSNISDKGTTSIRNDETVHSDYEDITLLSLQQTRLALPVVSATKIPHQPEMMNWNIQELFPR